MKEIYLDNQANTKISERVFNEMLPFLRENYGNAQSMHTLGARSKDAIENARKQAAALVGANEQEIYFTSCGSEANNLAIKGVAEANSAKAKHIVVSSVEHFSVLYSARRLSQAGFEVTYLPVDKYGMVSPSDVEKALRPDTAIVSIQHANTEIGTIQNIPEISRIVRAKKIPFHCDAVASAGQIPVDVNALGADLLTFSGAQFYGPRGAAALYVRKGARIIPQIDGGIQENGRRAGTENVPAIVGFGKACELAKNEMEQNSKKTAAIRDRIITELPKKIEYIYLNGHPTARLPNNVNFSVEFVEGEAMMLFLDQKGICVSSGSACASKALKMSHVLSAIKIDAAVAQGSILMSLSKYNSTDDADYVLNEFPAIVKKLRDMSPLYNYFQKTGKRQEAGPGTDYDHHHDHEEQE
ncbi:MAG TPA: cysteine desulfurase NifS [Elusimicrobia bacterium]|nr:MAG: cysteine desulfurase NifS [Elusimicrobia bacterium RIFOXYA12_FULL_49_49]OGS06783.1 MAG: cysteine desulfurase NifS [Elusimicrobia bacterium RIFOXYA1_FULL_47_7]OGS10604.1 MAG: cysteine desulfurase NifS [Elusimicrobia bacterium RIFOXYB1_FULL_48_9]OGS16298.1 MAG: cysteine desulfurase NifS [Elusimicrobia bacterium RIFOXYA2_FULL_47_53]OGS25842.1 MAG: cysteine desulfurase NifS [Elusimicrobia bacterium RIFOXYB12_FULL_50_12]OGS31453.1 MAG: cysteine desulfurase NifS [Elusimicrobia bacterium RIFO